MTSPAIDNTPLSATPLLGIECGGTRTVAILVDGNGQLIERHESVGSNIRLVNDTQLVDCFRALASRFPQPAGLGIGMAGVREAEDRRRALLAAAIVWPDVPCMVGNDLETALATEPLAADSPVAARVLIISGTGSSCHGKNRVGITAMVGGWGHVLGDQGSGYDIGLRAVKTVLANYDCTGIWPSLGQDLLSQLQLNTPNDLVDWAQGATKAEVAALTVEVCKARESGNAIAKQVVAGALENLADDAVACAGRLARRGSFVEFVLTGSVLLRQPRLRSALARMLRRKWGRVAVFPLKREGAWGAIELAKLALMECPSQKGNERIGKSVGLRPRQREADSAKSLRAAIPRSIRPSPTEQRNPASRKLDRLSVEQAIELMLRADTTLPAHLRLWKPQIAKAVRLIARALRQGGRLFYVGAGTSGRLGALDASECPPTFSVPADVVQAIMAGGSRALLNSMEDAEDDTEAGAKAVQCRGVSAKDVVVGISASGQAPFVWGALAAAKQQRAHTILVCFNPHLEFTKRARPHIIIAPNIGPEVLTGSTRLRAGTATKMILNMFTTLAMVQLDKVVSNLMVDLYPTNAKLRRRAISIVRELAGVDEAEGRKALDLSDWRIKAALARLKRTSITPKRRHSKWTMKRRGRRIETNASSA